MNLSVAFVFGLLLGAIADALDRHYRLTQIELDLLLRRLRGKR